MMLRQLIPAIALGAILLSGCGAQNTRAPVDGDLQAELREGPTDASLAELAAFLRNHPDAGMDTKTRAELVAYMRENMPVLMATISDPDSGKALEVTPEDLLDVVAAVPGDDDATSTLTKALSGASATDVDAATNRFVIGEQTSFAQAQLFVDVRDIALSTAALGAALGVEGFESDVTFEAVAGYLTSGEEVTAPPGRSLVTNAVGVSSYLHVPAASLPKDLSGRPDPTKPGVKDLIYAWQEGETAPITMYEMEGLSAEVEAAWTEGEALAHN